MEVIQASIPLFFLLIALELGVARVRGRRLYRLSDSISDLSCGVLSQLTGIFLTIGTLALYAWISGHFAVQHWLPIPGWIDRTPFPSRSGGLGFGIDPAALMSWLTVFVLDDLIYYWVHRSSHVVNILWAGHVVHHSSEEYNLSVALRQSSLHGLMTWIFYVPLALLGVPVLMWAVCHALNLIYQFWIHTRGIDRLPAPLEAVLNTPSHHRVHHGVNLQYQDKNYAGVFIVWDRMFGTFEPEIDEPVYGITKPLASWNPVWANVHVFAEIGRNVGAAASWRERVRIVFGHPGWKAGTLGADPLPPRAAAAFVKYESRVPAPLTTYASIQFVIALGAAIALLAAAPTLPVIQLLAGVFYLVLTLGNIGAVLEGRAWAAVSEVARLSVLAVACVVLIGLERGPTLWLGAALAAALGSLVTVVWLRPRFTLA